MNSWIYLVVCSSFVFPSDAGSCGGENCVLKEWVVTDCSPCCQIDSSPLSAVLKRWICCPPGNDLAQCIKHCHLTNDQVEKKGLCTVYCPNKCTGKLQATTNRHTLIQTPDASSATINTTMITNTQAAKTTRSAFPSTTRMTTTPSAVLTASRTGTKQIRSKPPPTRVTTKATSKATASRITRTITAWPTKEPNPLLTFSPTNTTFTTHIKLIASTTTQPNPMSTFSTTNPTFSTQTKLIASPTKLPAHITTFSTQTKLKASTTKLPAPISTISTTNPTFSKHTKRIASTTKQLNSIRTFSTTNPANNGSLPLTNNMSYIQLSPTRTPDGNDTASRITRTTTASATKQLNLTSTLSTKMKLIASTAKLSTHSSRYPKTNQTNNASLPITNNMSYILLTSTRTPDGKFSAFMQEGCADDQAKQNASYGIMTALFFVGTGVGVLATLSVSWFLKKRKERMSVKQQEDLTEPNDEK